MERNAKKSIGGLVSLIVLLAACLFARNMLSTDTPEQENSWTQEAKSDDASINNAKMVEEKAAKARIDAWRVTWERAQKLEDGEKSPDCVDYRDNGDDIFVKGSTYSQGKLRQEYCNFADQPSNTSVNEFSCNSVNPIADNRVKCPEWFACSDGACAKKPEAKVLDARKVEATGKTEIEKEAIKVTQ